MPCADELADQPVDLRLGADVDAAGRLVQQQHARCGGQPLADHHLLLVAARQRAGRLLRRRRCGSPACRWYAAPARSPGRGATRPNRASDGMHGQGDIAVDRGAQHEPVALAVLGDQRQAGPLGGRAASRSVPACRRSGSRRREASSRDAEQGLQQLGAAGTHQPGRGPAPRRRRCRGRRRRPDAAASRSAAGWPATGRAPTAPAGCRRPGRAVAGRGSPRWKNSCTSRPAIIRISSGARGLGDRHGADQGAVAQHGDAVGRARRSPPCGARCRRWRRPRRRGGG